MAAIKKKAASLTINYYKCEEIGLAIQKWLPDPPNLDLAKSNSLFSMFNKSKYGASCEIEL